MENIAPALLDWFYKNRRILPFREDPTPYHVWLSEVMLQQTRVSAVLPYYYRFLEALPDIPALAACEEERLHKLWEGLGYYSRVRNLQKAAKLVCAQYGGQLPADYAALRALPGIGDYTAGAILSIAFGVPIPAVDGNVLRILSRFTGSDLDILDAKNRKIFRTWAAAALPAERPGAFNQALMDLGSAVCLPGPSPRCGDCPLAHLCAARQEGKQAMLPVRTPKREKRREEMTVFLLRRTDGAVALCRRPQRGLLAGLWEYPNIPGLLTEVSAARQLAAWGLAVQRWEKSWRAKHVFTHVRWDMQGYAVTVTGDGELEWYTAEQRRQMAIPSAFERATRVLEELEGE